MEDLLAREHFNQYDSSVFTNAQKLTRAEAIDRIFKGSAEARIEDKSVVYQAIGMLDRYLLTIRHTENDFNPQCYLAAYTSLFLSSKNSEVDPLNIKDVRDYFLNKIFSREKIIEMEKQVRLAASHENEVPSLFDNVMMFMKVLKMRC